MRDRHILWIMCPETFTKTRDDILDELKRFGQVARGWDLCFIVPGWPKKTNLDAGDTVDLRNIDTIASALGPIARLDCFNNPAERDVIFGLKSTDLIDYAYPTGGTAHWFDRPENPACLADPHYWKTVDDTAVRLMAATSSNRWAFDGEFITAGHLMDHPQRWVRRVRWVRAWLEKNGWNFDGQYVAESGHAMVGYFGRADEVALGVEFYPECRAGRMWPYPYFKNKNSGTIDRGIHGAASRVRHGSASADLADDDCVACYYGPRASAKDYGADDVRRWIGDEHRMALVVDAAGGAANVRRVVDIATAATA